MAVRLLDVHQQFFNDDGDPLAGGKVSTYIANTSTPLAVYTDAEGAVAHTNPIILDSAGRPPSPIYYTVGSAYKALLFDENDVQQNTVLNILVGSDDTAYDVSFFYQGGPPGASELMFRHSFTRDVTFPQNFEGLAGKTGTNPTSTFTMDAQKNDVSVGSVVFSTGGVISASTSGAVSFAAGDYLDIVGPGSADATAADINVTLPGSVG
jgi:hypothetical protein